MPRSHDSILYSEYDNSATLNRSKVVTLQLDLLDNSLSFKNIKDTMDARLDAIGERIQEVQRRVEAMENKAMKLKEQLGKNNR